MLQSSRVADSSGSIVRLPLTVSPVSAVRRHDQLLQASRTLRHDSVSESSGDIRTHAPRWQSAYIPRRDVAPRSATYSSACKVFHRLKSVGHLPPPGHLPLDLFLALTLIPNSNAILYSSPLAPTVIILTLSLTINPNPDVTLYLKVCLQQRTERGKDVVIIYSRSARGWLSLCCYYTKGQTHRQTDNGCYWQTGRHIATIEQQQQQLIKLLQTDGRRRVVSGTTGTTRVGLLKATSCVIMKGRLKRFRHVKCTKIPIPLVWGGGTSLLGWFLKECCVRDN